MLAFIPLQAQWNIGGLIDLNLANISVSPEPSSEDYSGRVGFGIGFVANRPLTDDIYLQLEPMFLQKGAKIETSEVSIVYKTSYLEIPVMFNYAFHLDGAVSPYAMAGPNLGFRLSAKYDIEGGSTQDEKESTSAVDFGLGFGGGVSIPHENLTFFAETRYVFGLIDINSDSDEATVKNRGLQIILGVTVPLGKN